MLHCTEQNCTFGDMQRVVRLSLVSLLTKSELLCLQPLKEENDICDWKSGHLNDNKVSTRNSFNAYATNCVPLLASQHSTTCADTLEVFALRRNCRCVDLSESVQFSLSSPLLSRKWQIIICSLGYSFTFYFVFSFLRFVRWIDQS